MSIPCLNSSAGFFFASLTGLWRCARIFRKTHGGKRPGAVGQWRLRRVVDRMKNCRERLKRPKNKVFWCEIWRTRSSKRCEAYIIFPHLWLKTGLVRGIDGAFLLENFEQFFNSTTPTMATLRKISGLAVFLYAYKPLQAPTFCYIFMILPTNIYYFYICRQGGAKPRFYKTLLFNAL